jgi:Pyruvate/2-oxoacid:ferredoxin oxidoreductase delta subunit
MAHKEQGYRFRIDYDYDHRKNVVDSLEKAIVFPVNTEIKQDQMVLNFDKVKQLVEFSELIAVMDCSCRVDLKRCDAPADVCMYFNGAAEKKLTSEDSRIQSYKPHQVTKDEAMDILKKATEAGLVHMAYVSKENPSNIGYICSCCSCCCEILGGILRFGMAPHILTASAKSVQDESKCTSCGVCVDRCHFGSRKMANGNLEYNPERCYGCGLCVSTCPTKAITLTDNI